MEEIHGTQKSNALPIEQLKTAHIPSRLRSLLELMLAFEPAARPGIYYLAAQLRVYQQQDKRTRVPKKSIAVLPLENLSVDPENTFFSDGVHAEILTHLTKIAGLKVISRNSVMTYERGVKGNLREIAKELGVAHLVQGSVQRAGDQVRVNVQLIKAQTDSHLWADTFDRKLTDVFAVESEIAEGIAESLQAKLTRREEQALAVKPTNDPEAYDAYLRGLSYEGRSAATFTSYSPDLLGKAASFYEGAVQRDPNFAVAWARLCRIDAFLYFNRLDSASIARGNAAKHALENAQELQPNSTETLLALGYYQVWVLRDYGLAKSTFEHVRKMLPASSEVLEALGYVTRREGHWDQSVAYFEQALALDPRSVGLLMRAAITYGMLRQFSAALKLYDRVLDIAPNDPDTMATKASIYQAQGSLQEAARFLSQVNERTPTEGTFSIKIAQLQLERNYHEAIRLLQIREAQFHFASQDEKVRNELALAFMQRFAGNMAGAKATAQQARDTLEELYRDQPDDAGSPLYQEFLKHGNENGADLTAWLSQAYAAMEDRDSALKKADRATMLCPRPKDPMLGPAFEGNQALIQTIFGENSRAISTLTQLLQTPYKSLFYGQTCITPALLRLDPIWDPLRGDPAFQKLCEESSSESP